VAVYFISFFFLKEKNPSTQAGGSLPGGAGGNNGALCAALQLLKFDLIQLEKTGAGGATARPFRSQQYQCAPGPGGPGRRWAPRFSPGGEGVWGGAL